MSALQNFKNFIRHGKQARVSNAHADATTNVSNVHATQHHHHRHRQPEHQAISEPNVHEKKPLAAEAHGDFSVAAVDNKNVAAQAGEAAARAAEHAHKVEEAKQAAKKGDVDPSVIERIVAEERESRGKMPRYPGLERWELIEKMGDGAFSNVYRARDLDGQHGEAAIKVVRKFEMNSSQVSNSPFLVAIFYPVMSCQGIPSGNLRIRALPFLFSLSYNQHVAD
jgi:serine/threonine-protein kinase RCK2